MIPPLHIVATGMVTAVGLDAPSTCAALRARIDGFRETRFLGPAGDWLAGAAVPLPRNWIGTRRLAHLAAGAIVEALAQVPGLEADAALILCLAEEGRPGRPITDPASFARLLGEIAEIPPATRTRIIAHGRPGGVVALQTARKILAEGQARAVVICGVDSYLTGQSVAHYLGLNRLLVPGNANGFIPGEAAAAVVCTLSGPGLRVAGLGLAREDAFLYNQRDEGGLDLPLRGDGMARAYTHALEEAGVKLSDTTLKVGDHAGEKFFFQQTALAMLRVQRERSEVQPIWTIGASLGNIGAAVVPLMLGWMHAATARGYAPPGPILIESSADDGACGAAIVGRA
jgi:3-oxoacyl-[acyl-carrier-protein] synthase I